jgi:photosystem II stability/assembly factor-like uncharacterized protein
MLGTMKGLFLATPGNGNGWTLSGPSFKGHVVYAATIDQREGRHRLWAAASNPFWGTHLCWSDDLGENWTIPEEALVKFPEAADTSLKQIWQIVAPAGEPDALYCGVEPAALFKSEDIGATWSLCQGLWDHPHRPQWSPGGGGLCLHTVVPHPADTDRMLIAVSTGGVYQTADGGASWRVTNKGVSAEFLPDKFPEFGQCVHKVQRNPNNADQLFLQNHWGVFRSDDGGENWVDIGDEGLPSDFGFAMAVTSSGAACVIPLEADTFRCTPEGKLRVYRTADGGTTWEPLTKGLPQQDAFETVLRDAFTADGEALFFGTRSGKVFGSGDSGDSWEEMFSGLPPVTMVKTATVLQ